MKAPPENSIHSKTRGEWRAWLEGNHSRNKGVWFIGNKKATGKPRVEHDVAVEEALCFGWIDSKPNKLDEERSMRWFAPRKAGSGWSRPNKERVECLIASVEMTAVGLSKIEAVKADGSWNALDSIEELEIPSALEAAFAAYDVARPNFEAFPRSVKRGILEWIFNAKKPETRARRVEETARLAQENVRANQWRK
jgi:uncharacterized protein YdeI (YjbR/CyaY-like superfamily)